MAATTRRFEVLRRDRLYEGFFRAERVHLQHELFHGGMSPPITREVMIKPPAAGVLPYDPQRDEVLLIEQFRVGALQAARGPWLLEIIAGYIEAGESGEDMVRREAQEEAGQSLLRVEHAIDFLLSPASCDEVFSLYVAQADLTQAGGVHGLASEGEDIQVHVMRLEQAWQAALHGRVNNAPALLALQWLRSEKPRLLKRWQAP